MNQKQQEFNSKKPLYEARAQIIKALAHPTRLFIVDQLSEKENCVCKLTEMIGADTSTELTRKFDALYRDLELQFSEPEA